MFAPRQSLQQLQPLFFKSWCIKPINISADITLSTVNTQKERGGKERGNLCVKDNEEEEGIP